MCDPLSAAVTSHLHLDSLSPENTKILHSGQWSLSGEGYEPVARSSGGNRRFLGSGIWVCPGLYGESSRPILMKVCRMFTGMV